VSARDAVTAALVRGLWFAFVGESVASEAAFETALLLEWERMSFLDDFSTRLAVA
jgi:hypothetical protein